MTHWLILPIVLPAMLAAFMVLAARYHLLIQRVLSVTGTLGLLALALGLFWQASDGTVGLYQLGNWAAPFGIVLVADRLSTLMVLLTCVLAVPVLLYAIGSGWDNRGRHFHPLFQFQLMGLNGAFLTGDLFNLFVFFEVLLIASYGLMLHGQGPARLKAGVQYVVVNLVGSSIFLLALGLLYALTGTLNMADMGVRIPAIEADDQWLLRIAALLLFVVFAIKAAIVPLHLWLPRTYAVATPAVAALFAIMTKIGVYSIIRVTPLIFGDDAGAAAWAPAPYLLPAAMVTALLGFGGVFTARSLSEQAAYAIIGSTGTLMIAVAGWQADTVGAALYYLVHSTLAGAALFLIADVVARRRAGFVDHATPGPVFAHRQSVAILFMVAAIGVTGLPPLSGFIGKLLILDAVADLPLWGWAWTVILLTTLIGVIGFARAGSTVFWKDTPLDEGDGAMAVPSRADMIAPAALLVLLAALSAAAGPATAYADAAAAQLLDSAATARAVLDNG